MRVFDYSVRVLNSKNNAAAESTSGHVQLKNGEQYTLLLRNNSKRDAIAAIRIDGVEIAHIKVPANDKVKIDAPVNSDKKFTFYRANSEEGDELGLDQVDKKDLGLIEVKFVAVDNSVTYTPIYSGTSIIYVPYREYWPVWFGPYTYPTWTTTTPFTYTEGGNGGTTTTSVFHTVSSASVNMTTTNAAPTTFTANYNTSTHKSFKANAGGTGLSGMAQFEPKDVQESRKEFKKHYDEDSLTTIYLRLVEGEDLKEKPVRLMGYSNPIPDPV